MTLSSRLPLYDLGLGCQYGGFLDGEKKAKIVGVMIFQSPFFKKKKLVPNGVEKNAPQAIFFLKAKIPFNFEGNLQGNFAREGDFRVIFGLKIANLGQKYFFS
jgi:hypothetical protein